MSVADLVTAATLAESTTFVIAATGTDLTIALPVVEPAAMTTEVIVAPPPSTKWATGPLFVISAAVMPLDGATLLSVTVPTTFLPPTTDVGANLNDKIAGIGTT